MPCARMCAAPTSARATLIAGPPSVMLFGRALGWCRKSEPSAVMLLYDTGRQTDLEPRAGLVVLGLWLQDAMLQPFSI